MPKLRFLMLGLALSLWVIPALAQGQTLPSCSRLSFSAAGSGLSRSTFLQAINRIRATPCRCPKRVFPSPLAALTWSTQLEAAARAHSQDMQQHNFFSHTGWDGSSLGDRVTRAGYRWAAIGENIAAGQPSMDAVLRAWLASTSGHCEVIKQASFRAMGAALVRGSSGNTFNTYWTLDFGKPR